MTGARDSTAGTAGDGYRVAVRDHAFEPAPLEPDCRSTCRECGAEKGVHIPTQRRRA